MIAIRGTNVSSIPTPAIRPSTTNPSTRLPPRPIAPSARSAAVVTGPVKKASSAPCRGAAALVVSVKMPHITARNSSGPTTGAVTQRSTRSVHVRRTSWLRVVAACVVSVTQANSASAWARSSSAASVSCSSARSVTAHDVQSAGQASQHPPNPGSMSGRGRGPASTSATAAARPVTSRRRGSSRTTGTPSRSDSARSSMLTPRRAATSVIVTATTTRTGSSRTCAASTSERARCAPSQAITTASTRSVSCSSSAVRASSGDCGSKE